MSSIRSFFHSSLNPSSITLGYVSNQTPLHNVLKTRACYVKKSMPTTFFSLSLELRQQVYEAILPAPYTKALHVGYPQAQDYLDPVIHDAVTKADPQAGKELRAWELQRVCLQDTVEILIVGNDHIYLPMSIDACRLKRIVIRLDYYDVEDIRDRVLTKSYCVADCTRQYECERTNHQYIMYRNLNRIVRMLARTYTEIDLLVVGCSEKWWEDFEEDWGRLYDKWAVPDWWATESIGHATSEEDSDMDVRGEGKGKGKEDTMLTRMFRPLAKLPKCKKVDFRLIRPLNFAKMDFAELKVALSFKGHVQDLERSYREWLEGDRQQQLKESRPLGSRVWDIDCVSPILYLDFMSPEAQEQSMDSEREDEYS